MRAEVIYRYMHMYPYICVYVFTHTYTWFHSSQGDQGGTAFLTQLLWIFTCKVTDQSLPPAAGQKPGTAGHVLPNVIGSEKEVSFAFPLILC